MPQQLLTFCLDAMYDTLSTPSNLHCWHINPEASCLLWKKQVCTTAHVLAACTVALPQGRFTFHHDYVLSALVVALESLLSSKKCNNAQSNKSMEFVKAGAKFSKYTKRKHSRLLHLTADWKLLSDLGYKLVFTSFIAITCLRPDIVLFSASTRTVIILELTCPCDENMEEWHQKKFFKYDPLTTSIRYNGWSVYFFAVQIGARGYCSTCLESCLLHLGLPSKLVQPILKSLSLASLKASFQSWQARDSKK